ncbi:MAG: FIST C-terminal domain-containing protein [Deferribacteraceae bacterium]|nr:FIST C-terminal domain-containing protein [Deferribacteraceae bacterium]
MRATVGFSDNPDTIAAGEQAALAAIGGEAHKPDLVLLFSTARHDPAILQKSVASVIGAAVPIYGGIAIGAISAERFGYSGDQLVLAAIWLEGASYEAIVEHMCDGGEGAAGARIGKRLKELGAGEPNSSILLFYDTFRQEEGKPVKMFMAMPLLAGIEAELGFLPELAGAGLMGDLMDSPSALWTGSQVEEHVAVALYFSGVQMDIVIMHGCRPSTDYYTVTKADSQTILEINHEPALAFMQKVLGSVIAPEAYPFFLILGVNQGEKWGEFDEESYASRLCLAIDTERSGIVMFEPDMVEGTEFQIMHRSMELDYMPPRMQQLFDALGERKPALALYINCAGRAGYGNIEDALVVQQAVQGKVPLVGIYSGVEIAPVKGRSRGLDWTGVFCLFSS